MKNSKLFRFLLSVLTRNKFLNKTHKQQMTNRNERGTGNREIVYWILIRNLSLWFVCIRWTLWQLQMTSNFDYFFFPIVSFTWWGWLTVEWISKINFCFVSPFSHKRFKLLHEKKHKTCSIISAIVWQDLKLLNKMNLVPCWRQWKNMHACR